MEYIPYLWQATSFANDVAGARGRRSDAGNGGTTDAHCQNWLEKFPLLTASNLAN